MMWTEKYRPKKFSEIAGHQEAKAKLVDFVRNFKKQRKKALLLHGAAGSGKTSLVYALAFDMAFEIIELNASDFRNKQKIHDILGAALKQHSLFTKGKIILVDELDGISGTKDRGGLQELIRLIKETAWPIILTVNDAWQSRLRSLRVKTQLIEIKPLDKNSLMILLQKICKKENLSIQYEALEALIAVTKGDVRAVINDLQSFSVFSISNKTVTKKDVASLCEQGREKDESIFNALKLIFKSKSARGAFNNVNLRPDDFFLWLDENLPLEYQGKELERAYDKLSMADVFRGRIRRQQHWRFLAYIMDLITVGIACAKQEQRQRPGSGFTLATPSMSSNPFISSTSSTPFTSYKPPTRILKIWMAKQKLAKKKAIAEKLAKATHTSKKQAYKELPYLQMAFQASPDKTAQFARELRLEQEELDYFKNQ